MDAHNATPSRRTPMRRATSKDVAALAGVAQSTVSYALTGSRPVAKETLQRIEAAMKQLNYHTNSSARTLRTSKTQLIGLIQHIGAQDDGMGIPPYLSTIARESRRNDYDIILSTMVEGGRDIQRLYSRAVCDGFIIMDIIKDDPRIAIAAGTGLPTVLFGLPTDPQGLDTVYFNYAEAAVTIITDLVGSGHHHLAFVGEIPHTAGNDSPNFIRYLERALSESKRQGIPARIVTPPMRGWQGIERIGHELFRDIDDRLAVIVRDPRSTDLVMRFAELHNLTPGKDFTLIGIMNDYAASSLKIPVSNLSPRPETVSTLAVDTLIKRIDDPTRPMATFPVPPLGVTHRDTTMTFGD